MTMDLFSGMLLGLGVLMIGYFAYLVNKDEAKKAATSASKEHQA
jgi:hypothetical protein